jgi:aspartate racemase
MKTVGIIGGIGPESTIEYYRFIIEGYRAQRAGGGYPSIVINSVDLDRLVGWLNAEEMGPFVDYLVAGIEKLERAGVDFVVMAANTAHIVCDEIRARVSTPLLSIVESTRDEAKRLGLTKVGLLGTGFTMKARFYPDVFSAAGLTVVTPTEEEQAFIHEKYFGELLKNVFLPETRARLLAIVDQMKERDKIEGLLLAGTELPLLMRAPEHNGVQFLDTTKIHVESIVELLLQ